MKELYANLAAFLLMVGAWIVLTTGCANLYSTTKTTVDRNGNPVTKTRVFSYTLFDSQAALTKFQNRGQLTSSNQWAPGTSITGLNQSASSTNVNDLIGTVVSAAVKAAK